MIASAHLAVGALGGRLAADNYSSGHRAIRIGLAFLSGVTTHVVMDAFPHEEYISRGHLSEWPWPLVISEAIIVIILILSTRMPGFNRLVLFAGMAGGAFPDLLSRAPRGSDFNIEAILHRLHGDMNIGFEVPILIQVMLAIISILITRYKPAS